jgi:hypothetical protein
MLNWRWVDGWTEVQLICLPMRFADSTLHWALDVGSTSKLEVFSRKFRSNPGQVRPRFWEANWTFSRSGLFTGTTLGPQGTVVPALGSVVPSVSRFCFFCRFKMISSSCGDHHAAPWPLGQFGQRDYLGDPVFSHSQVEMFFCLNTHLLHNWHIMFVSA